MTDDEKTVRIATEIMGWITCGHIIFGDVCWHDDSGSVVRLGFNPRTR